MNECEQMKLLLVDDDDLVRATFGKELMDHGFDVILADNASEGLNAVETHDDIDLAILDIKMPGISGLEMTPGLKKRQVPWLFLSAYDDAFTVKRASEEGAMGFLVKPLEASRAIPSILSAIRRANEIDELEINKEKLTGAIETGSTVNVAIGILMERHKINKQDAFEILRSKARTERRKVKDVADEYLSDWEKLTEFTNDH